mmetsp:Transcript_11957/g.26846  ORF Transcript_11957/g.26846 Transcript_11957/m.26846 type:complete len:213 (-) Transcript_11957:377-1015(-)
MCQRDMRQPSRVKVPASWYRTKSFSAANCLLVTATYCFMLFCTLDTSISIVSCASCTCCPSTATMVSTWLVMRSSLLVTLYCAWKRVEVAVLTALCMCVTEAFRWSSTRLCVSCNALLLSASRSDTFLVDFSISCCMSLCSSSSRCLTSVSVCANFSSTSALDVPFSRRDSCFVWKCTVLSTVDMFSPIWRKRLSVVDLYSSSAERSLDSSR